MWRLLRVLVFIVVSRLSNLKPLNFGGWRFLVNPDLGYYPYFSSILRMRVEKKKPCNIVVTGEPGDGKSYLAFDLARVLEGKTKPTKKHPTGNDRFKLWQIVYTYKQFMRLINKKNFRMGKVIVFDEPSYAISKRDWYKDLNKVLVQTIESFRFKVHPLLIPVLNKSLLDKTIRNYLIQFQVTLRDRGKAIVYRLSADQHSDRIYRTTLCELRYGMFDRELCDRDTCLDCEKLPTCPIFRARYERRKDEMQSKRYEEALDLAIRKETASLSNEMLVELLYPLRDNFVKKGKIDSSLLIIVCSQDLKHPISRHRSYLLRSMLERKYPKVFKS